MAGSNSSPATPKSTTKTTAPRTPSSSRVTASATEESDKIVTIVTTAPPTTVAYVAKVGVYVVGRVITQAKHIAQAAKLQCSFLLENYLTVIHYNMRLGTHHAFLKLLYIPSREESQTRTAVTLAFSTSSASILSDFLYFQNLTLAVYNIYRMQCPSWLQSHQLE